MLLALCALSLFSLYMMALFRGRFWDPLLDAPEEPPAAWPDVDIIVPARNEADVLPDALPSLLNQDYRGRFRVLLIDDHSTDGTAQTAQRLAKEAGHEDRLKVITAPDLPQGWTGKVAAMQAGVAASTTPFILFTDADIAHAPFSLSRLVARSQARNYDLTSLMVKLRCSTFAEKLLIPAFVFFFALLYPFRLANTPSSPVAAAAGGVMLARREALDKSGGLASIKNALIDDCSLARSIKQSGGKICLTLTKDVLSLRAYKSFREIHDMIARSAYIQLKKSPLLLALSTLSMSIVFLVPVWAVLTLDSTLVFLGGSAWLVMGALYAPTVLFYGLPALWAATLPLAALFYMVAKINSARRTWAGQGGAWKGRTQCQ